MRNSCWWCRARGLVALAALALTVVASGCSKGGEETATVSGKVTIDNKPLNGGRIDFIGGQDPKHPINVGNEISEDGTYTVKGVALGTNKVTVSTPGAASGSVPPGMKPPGLGTGKNVIPVPLKYNSTDSSGLQTDVKKGDNTYNPELKSQ